MENNDVVFFLHPALGQYTITPQQATSGIYKALFDGHSFKITDCYTYRHDIGAGMYAAVCDKMTMKKVMYSTGILSFVLFFTTVYYSYP